MNNIEYKVQTPAEGILLHKDWGDTQSYSIQCECGDPEHRHYLWVEADDCDVSVTIYTDQTTDFWTANVEPRYDIDNELAQWYNWFWTRLWNGFMTRVRLTKDIWLHDKVTYQSTVCLSPQAAQNYSEVLKKAAGDVVKFKKEAK